IGKRGCARRHATRYASGRKCSRRQPTEEAPGQTTAVVENDARRSYLTISEHSGLIAHQVSRRDMRLPPPSLRGALATKQSRFAAKNGLLRRKCSSQ